MKLYSKKGDRGRTSLFSGRKASKADPRVTAVGELDELSASLGFARLGYPPSGGVLGPVQRQLYSISAIISAEGRRPELAFDPTAIQHLEHEIDRISDALSPLRDFIFPGEAEASCRLHLARAVARRAERNVSVLTDPEPSNDVLAYLNRLSDLLFALAREADHRDGKADVELKSELEQLTAQ